MAEPVSLPEEPWMVISPPSIPNPALSPTSFSTTVFPLTWNAATIEPVLPLRVRVPPLFAAPTNGPRLPRHSTLAPSGKCVSTPNSPSFGLSSPALPHPIFTGLPCSRACSTYLSRSLLSFILLIANSFTLVLPFVILCNQKEATYY